MKKLLMVLCSLGFLAGIFLGSGPVFADHNGDMNCDDFETGEEVMEFWNDHDYSENNDPDDLDRDSDGQPCENLTDGVYDGGDGEESTEDDDSTSEEADEEDSDESAASDGGDSGSSEEEGGELPDTATNNPLMIVMGALFAGAGVLFLRKNSVN
ncbi:LPXTG cell wall anchor domain-containing protein [Halobacillus sp. A5]|uniref:LPXTG cell wall anchor domain-containing protein n=1 Tax=Halobacillus sp. A5 TaxID=2880263 RepID=UPI0020A641D7|nr:LPXTG cell wall anchor domain-containing protein [Halobacillus sp. A5]MCP3029408.1 LPXTG cell wall anchor domain-containing protein [Halobacillus sp. A5]